MQKLRTGLVLGASASRARHVSSMDASSGKQSSSHSRTTSESLGMTESSLRKSLLRGSHRATTSGSYGEQGLQPSELHGEDQEILTMGPHSNGKAPMPKSVAQAGSAPQVQLNDHRGGISGG